MRNHRLTAWPGLKRTTMLISSNPLLCAGSPTSSPGCPEPHPAWPSMPAGMGHPQPPWATCSVRHHPLGEKLLPNSQPKPPLSQFKTIPPCPITIHPHKEPSVQGPWCEITCKPTRSENSVYLRISESGDYLPYTWLLYNLKSCF